MTLFCDKSKLICPLFFIETLYSFISFFSTFLTSFFFSFLSFFFLLTCTTTMSSSESDSSFLTFSGLISTIFSILVSTSLICSLISSFFSSLSNYSEFFISSALSCLLNFFKPLASFLSSRIFYLLRIFKVIKFLALLTSCC